MNGPVGRHQAATPDDAADPYQLGALGVREAREGRFDSAVRLLRQGVDKAPRAAELHNNLGMALHQLRRTDEAIAAYLRALAIRPRYAVALNNMGIALAALGRHVEAIVSYREALAIEPGYPEALNNQGSSLQEIGHAWQAARRFRRALALRPGFIEARANLGHALMVLGHPEEAIPCYQAVLKARPGAVIAHVNLAAALRDANRYAEAEEQYGEALALQPDLAPAHAGLGTILLEMGRMDEARLCFERAVAIEPKRPSHLLNLARTTTLTPGHRHLGPTLALAEDIEGLTKGDEIDAHFAVGKALSDIGEYRRSFEHLLAGNSLKRRITRYDEAAALGEMERIRAMFTAEFMANSRNGGIASNVPIFIVGMPRSGSTLIEQILASHPKVHGAGEVELFRDALRGTGLLTRARPYPDSVPDWTGGRLREAAGNYLRLLQARAGTAADTAQRTTDKLLSNFRHLGLIHLMLPRARIIHACRDPVDTCLSCFSIQFAKLPFAYDLCEWAATIEPTRR